MITYKRKFRNYLINKDLQLRLIRNNLFYQLICVIVTVSILLYPLVQDMIYSPDLESQYRAAQRRPFYYWLNGWFQRS
jgi:hypothetical protein